MILVEVKPDCFRGTALEFLNWRLQVARAAGYGVSAWEVDGATYLIPRLPYDTYSYENILGIWDIEPDDILEVLLAHSDEEGAIYPIHAGPLADRLEELSESINQIENDKGRTRKFIDGLRKAVKKDVAVTFTCCEMPDA